MDLRKAGSKKQGHCYSKREVAAWSLLFLNTNDPVFCNLLFSGPYLGLDFLKFQTQKKYRVDLINYKSGCRFTGRICTFDLAKVDFPHETAKIILFYSFFI